MSQTTTLFKPEADLLSALAHPIRLQMLEVLRGGEACVCHIQATLSPPRGKCNCPQCHESR